MRVPSILAASSLLSLVSASIFSSSPDLDAIAAFPESNPLSVVYNGQANLINVKLTNQGKTDLSIDAISGAFREVGGKERHLANTSVSKYSLVLPAGGRTGPVDVPYRFYSELKPQDLGFVVYVDYSDTSDLKAKKYRAVAYDGTVTVKEPQGSWFDVTGLLLWPVLLALIGLPAYFLYSSLIEPRLFPKTRKVKRTTVTTTKTTAVVAKSPTPRAATPSNPSEWIPEHHLKTRRTVSGRNLVAKGTGGITPQGATSGDETSGNESGTPRRSGRDTKGKKRA